MQRPTQYFSDEYLEQCRSMTPTQIIQFLDNYRTLQIDPGDLVQINLRVPKNILEAFKAKAKREGRQYQKKIRELIVEWAVS